MAALRGLRHSLGNLFALQTVFLLIPMGYVILLLLCRIVLRKSWPAIVVFVALCPVLGLDNFSTSSLYLGLAAGLLNILMFVLVLFRGGLLGIVVFGVSTGLLSVYPLTFDTGAWYGGSTLLGLSCVAALALYGFRTALAGRPAFGDAALPDA